MLQDYETRMVEQARSKLIVEFTQFYDSTYGAGDESAGGAFGLGSGLGISYEGVHVRAPQVKTMVWRRFSVPSHTHPRFILMVSQ